MKISINLLPESIKASMAKKRKFRDIIKQELLFFMPVLVFVLMLAGIDFVLKTQNGAIDAVGTEFGSHDNYRDIKAYEDKTKSANEKIANIKKFQDTHFLWSLVIDKISEATPEGILFEELSSKDYKMAITGTAKKRKDLVVFEENLEKSNCFEDINVPLSNLVIKNDIEFQMGFSIKKECIMGK